MTLKRRLIPKLQMQQRRIGAVDRMVLVTTVGFDHVVEIGDPISQSRIYQAQAADELIFLDIDAANHDRDAVLAVVRRASEEIFMPVTVGGGITSAEDVRILLAGGADKVSVNSAACRRPDLITELASAFGSQCVVASIDHRAGEAGGQTAWADNGQTDTGRDVISWAHECARRGAGEILLTSIERDGSRRGLDVELARAVVAAVDVPVIVSGGCGTAAHFVQGFEIGGADGVAAGTYFCFRDENPMQTRSQIANARIPIRQHR